MVTGKSSVMTENTVVPEVTMVGASATGVEPHLFDPESKLDTREEPVWSAEFPNAADLIEMLSGHYFGV